MIQRIQSIYMLMAVIIAAITFFVPLASFTAEGLQGFYELSGCSFKGMGIENFNGTPKNPWGVLISMSTYIVLISVAIFKFKKRMTQLKLIRWSYFVLFVYYIAVASYCYAFASNSETTFNFSIPSLLPIVALTLTHLAARAIRKDEALVRAADRIR